MSAPGYTSDTLMGRGHAAVVACLLCGCLPEAGPGIGERMVEARGLTTLALVPAPPGAARTLLFTLTGRPPSVDGTSRPAGRDLHVLLPGSATPELRLSDFAPVYGVRFDARGRLYAASGVIPGPPNGPLSSGLFSIVELDSGVRVDLGRASGPLMSPAGAQFIYSPELGITTIRTVDDVERLLPEQLRQPEFVDEVLYGNDGQRLWRVRPDGSPPAVLTDNTFLHYLVSPPGQPTAFVLVSGRDRCLPAEARLFRPDAPLQPMDLLGPVEREPSVWVAPDHTRLVLLTPRSVATEAAFRVITLDPRTMRTFVVPLAGPAARVPGTRPVGSDGSCPADSFRSLEVQFRPGTAEIWVGASQMLAILRQDGTVDVTTGAFQRFEPFHQLDGVSRSFDVVPPLDARRGSAFNADGRFLVYRATRGDLRISDASAPLSPLGLDLGDPDLVRGIGEMQRSRTLAIWMLRSSLVRTQIDLHLLDDRLAPLGRTVRDVRRVLFGDRRLLAITQGATTDPFAPGPLDLIDIVHGDQTRLAANVTEFLQLPTCATCDPTAPGAGLAYVTSARVPWKYDGLWMATLP